MKNEKSYETVIVERLRKELFKKLNNPVRLPYETETDYKNKIQPIVMLRFNKREMGRIEENWERIIAEGKRQNVEVMKCSELPETVIARYIFFDPMPLVWDV